MFKASACPGSKGLFATAYVDCLYGYREALHPLHSGVLKPLFPKGDLTPGYSFEVD